jgi:hypothetical protein
LRDPVGVEVPMKTGREHGAIRRACHQSQKAQKPRTNRPVLLAALRFGVKRLGSAFL